MRMYNCICIRSEIEMLGGGRLKERKGQVRNLKTSNENASGETGIGPSEDVRKASRKPAGVFHT